jgi:hypothetical protein
VLVVLVGGARLAGDVMVNGEMVDVEMVRETVAGNWSVFLLVGSHMVGKWSR